MIQATKDQDAIESVLVLYENVKALDFSGLTFRILTTLSC